MVSKHNNYQRLEIYAMNDNEYANGISPKAVESLRLPPEFAEEANESASELDFFLKQEERSPKLLETKLTAHRDTVLSHLGRFQGKQTFDLKPPSLSRLFGPAIPFFRWPRSLYIPKGANSNNYSPFRAPDDHRYGLDWIIPTSATGNSASSQNGTLSCFSELPKENANKAVHTESGLGIFYRPPMTLGVIDLQPQVNCSGLFNTLVKLSPEIGGGSVEVKAQIFLAMWQQIPGGFELLDSKVFDIATSGRRDDTFNQELQKYTKSYNDSSLSKSFSVQSSRTYLLGVVARISVIPNVFSFNGSALPVIDRSRLFAYGTLNCEIPQIRVLTRQINIL